MATSTAVLDELTDASKRQPKKSAIAALIGSAPEYYNFFIYASASALVFSRLFFDPSNPAVATLLSLATSGVAYMAHPVGAFVLGRWGDLKGRRVVMVFTLFFMGIATLAIGYLLTYDQIGVTAPALLVTCRLAQGSSADDEQLSANSMSLEHAPNNCRSSTTGWTMFGTRLGQVIAAGVFIPMAAIGEKFFMSVGWRIPFWLFTLVALVGWLIRRTLEEPPQFQAQAAEAGPRVKRDPMRILITRYWGPLVMVTILTLHNFETTIFSVWALSYGKVQGIAEAHMLSQMMLVQPSALVAIPLWILLADKFGHKKIYIGGYIVVAVLLWFYMTQLHDANVIGVYLLGFVVRGVFYPAVNGVWPAFYGEQFPTRVRLFGTSFGTQIGFTITGSAPTITTALVIGDATDFTPVYLLTVAVMAAVLLIATFGTRETAFKSLDQFDEEADEAEITKYGHSL